MKPKGLKKPELLSEELCIELLQESSKARINTFPKKGAGYAVAFLTKAGNIYTGVSYGSDTKTLTMHSEVTALAHAAIHGETEIVAIVGPNCNICKQLIYESSLRSGIDTLIIVEEEDRTIKQVPISEMMLYPWPESGCHVYVWKFCKFFTSDIYSCKKFDVRKVIKFSKKFWQSEDAVNLSP